MRPSSGQGNDEFQNDSNPIQEREQEKPNLPTSGLHVDVSSQELKDREQVKYAEVVLFCLHKDSCFRGNITKLVENPWFDRVVMLIILANCITLAMFDPSDRDCNKSKCKALQVVDKCISVFFICEVLCKVVTYGFWGPYSYLAGKSCNWNRLDFMVAVLGVVDLFSTAESGFLSVLRAVRVLRPLRFITRLPKLQKLTVILLSTLPKLPNVLILLLLTMLMLSCVGVQLFMGSLRKRCYAPVNGTFVDGLSPAFACDEDACGATIDAHYYCGAKSSGNAFGQCAPQGTSNFFVPAAPTYTQCQPWGDNPGEGAVAFDNIYQAMMTVWIVLSKEQGSGIMYAVQDSVSFWTFPFFIVSILIGSYMSLNLFLVVIAAQFALMSNEAPPVDDDDDQPMPASPELHSGPDSPSPQPGPTAKVAPENTDEFDESPPASASLKATCSCIASSPYFTNGASICIVANTIVLATEFHGQPKWFEDLQDALNITFTFLFLFEVVVKFADQGHPKYWSDSWNIFDFVVVASSIVELFVQLILYVSSAGSELSVFRALRLLRLLRLMPLIPGLQKQVEVLVDSMTSVISIFLLTFIFMFMAAILGMFAFGNKLEIRSNYDSFGDAILTVFTVFTLEDWPPIMYASVGATNAAASMYYVAIMLIGTYVLANLLVAILLQGFEEREKQQAFELQEQLRQSSALEKLCQVFVRFGPHGSFFFWWEAAVFDAQIIKMLGSREAYERVKLKFQNVFGVDDTKYRSLISTWSEKAKEASRLAHLKRTQSTWLIRTSVWVIESVWFDRLMMFFIAVSSLVMCFERPSIQDGSPERVALEVINYIVAFAFFAEMVLKIIALGLCGRDGYLRSSQNLFDCFLVLISVLHIIMVIIKEASNQSDGNVSQFIRALLVLRCLRPLRVVVRMKRLRVIVHTLNQAMEATTGLIVIYVLFLLVFSIMMVQLQKGALYSCSMTNGMVNGTLIQVRDKTDCLAVGGLWGNATLNFDNVFYAMFRVFFVSMLDGWVAMMFESMDAVGVDKQPVKNHSWYMAFFHVIVVLFLNYVVLNLYMGIILDSFKSGGMTMEDVGAAVAVVDLEGEEEEKEDTHKAKDGTDPAYLPVEGPGPVGLEFSLEPLDPRRHKMKQIVSSDRFNILVGSVILTNFVLICAEHYEQSSAFNTTSEVFNYVFLVLFIIEAVLKIYALGWHNYIADTWNKMDLFIIFVSLLDAIVLVFVADGGANVTVLRLFRIFRIARVVKFIRFMDELRLLVGIMIKALQGVWGLCMLLALSLFVYAAVGVELFGRLACTASAPCVGLSRHSNFENVGMAMLILFKYSTRDNGEGLARDILRGPPQCDDSADCQYGCCANKVVGCIYLVSFSMIVSFIVLNIIVAMLMELAAQAHAELIEEPDEKIDDGEANLHNLEQLEASKISEEENMEAVAQGNLQQ